MRTPATHCHIPSSAAVRAVTAQAMRSDGTPARVRYTIPQPPSEYKQPSEHRTKNNQKISNRQRISLEMQSSLLSNGAPSMTATRWGVSHPPAISNVEASVTPATQASRSLSSRGDPTSECGTAQQQPSTAQIRIATVYSSLGPYAAGSAATHRWSSIGSASTIFIQTTLQSPAEERTPLWEPVFPASTRTTS